jgi:Flp pilus assembly protein TadG
MFWLADLFVQFRTQPRRALAVEIACLAPALALVAVAGFGWGGYFCLQSRVQTAANQALEAAMAAPDQVHRRAWALAAAERALGPRLMDLEMMTEPDGRPTLRIAYDASGAPVFGMARFAPRPPAVIVRQASRL